MRILPSTSRNGLKCLPSLNRRTVIFNSSQGDHVLGSWCSKTPEKRGQPIWSVRHPNHFCAPLQKKLAFYKKKIGARVVRCLPWKEDSLCGVSPGTRTSIHVSIGASCLVVLHWQVLCTCLHSSLWFNLCHVTMYTSLLTLLHER